MEINIAFKEKLHDYCLQLITGKLEALNLTLQDLSASVANETKSTAGDKYETARAMLHIEQDQVRSQIATLAAQLSVLKSIAPGLKTTRVTLGSVVLAGNNVYYISIALGRLTIGTQVVFALSLQAPLGKQLKGLIPGDEVTIQGNKQIITEVL